MAGISFLDLLFAEAIAAGLARQAMRAERPPPENFFVLPKDPRAWKLIHAKNKAENMVCAIEITNNGRENCRRVQPLFVDLAREFDSIPFLQVAIAPGATYDEVHFYIYKACARQPSDRINVHPRTPVFFLPIKSIFVEIKERLDYSE